MGRRIHGTERKVRHTITIDGDLVRRACAYGDAMKIAGLSGSIIMDLLDFDRWAKKRGRPRKQSAPSD